MKNNASVLVTGANGQLGLTLKDVAENYTDINFKFYDSSLLDITNKEELVKVLDSKPFDYCINCAAFTNVEQAEINPKRAFSTNLEGVRNLVSVLKGSTTTLIHISTDYVFDGKKNTAYTEEDIPNPINAYGRSKLAGEIAIQEGMKQYYIVRASWLYSRYRKNFFNTIKARLLTKEKLYVNSTQTGSPTSALSLSKALIHIIKKDKKKYGIFHFSNKGSTNWYIFAKSIIELVDSKSIHQLFEVQEFKTKAQRPNNSKLDSSKFEKEFDYQINDWRNELNEVNINN